MTSLRMLLRLFFHLQCLIFFRNTRSLFNFFRIIDYKQFFKELNIDYGISMMSMTGLELIIPFEKIFIEN